MSRTICSGMQHHIPETWIFGNTAMRTSQLALNCMN